VRGIWGIHPGWGLTVLRIAVSMILMQAGYNKFIRGVGGVSVAFAKYGIPLPGVMAPYIVTLETIGGLLLLLGIAGRWIGLLVACEFVVAAFWVKFPLQGWLAGRVDLMILAASIAIFLGGPGRAAVDEVWLEKPGSPAGGRIEGGLQSRRRPE
jgi:putative oxidoreductase